MRHTSPQDALWFALGANRENGQRMTRGDVRHAVTLALETWGTSKSDGVIAAQLGCSDSTVLRVRQVLQEKNLSNSYTSAMRTGKDGKSYPAVQLSKVGQPRIEALLTCRRRSGSGHARRQLCPDSAGLPFSDKLSQRLAARATANSPTPSRA
jgi:hypothetical protein